MYKNFKDITGQKFGRLTVIETVGRNKKDGCYYWRCKCDCGNEKVVNGALLRKGNTKSCGCLLHDFNIGYYSTHGLTHTHLFRLWLCIRARTNPSRKNYGGNYKKNNITVCDEWKSDFKAFYDWAIASGYKYEKLPCGKNKWTIDRIDNNKGYSPDNCRWVDMKVQANNRTNNVFITYNGRTQTLAQWAEELNKSPTTIRQRLQRGLSVEEAFTLPPATTNKKKEKKESVIMKSVLISIRPKWCELIANGNKTVEVRKTAPKLQTPFKCYIYCTVGKNPKDILTFAEYENGVYQGDYGANGKVIGEFVCDRIDKFECYNELPYDKYNLSKSVLKNMCLICHDVDKYGAGKPIYGWHISNLIVYDKPKEISDFFTDNFDDKDYNGIYMRNYLSRSPQSWCYVEEQ